jgi:hypothetical protein
MRDVEIRDLVVRLPGITPGEAPALAMAIARRLTDTLPQWRGTAAPALARIRVRVNAGASPDDIVRQVSAAIAEALRVEDARA